MKYTQLGRSGLKVSRLCLGTMNFGPQTEPVDAFAIMDRAHDAGINFFDTANVYGQHTGRGRTESIVGEWFGQGGARRERTVLATKVYAEMGDWPNEGRLSALHIRQAVDASLRRLQTDYIDLYQMHHVDRLTPWDEIWEAFDVLRHQGKVIYFGTSNFAGWHIAQGQESAWRKGLLGLVSEQCIYNLAVRNVEMEVVPAAQHYGLGVIPWSPLQSGLLGGVIRKEAEQGTRRTSGLARRTLEALRPTLEKYEELCDEVGQSPADVALAWLLGRPGVTAPIIGPRTMEQLDGAIGAVDVVLDDATVQHLDEIFPGPGTAPEAHAW